MGRRALERLGRRVCADQAGDDDGGGEAKRLVGKVDLLDGLLTRELLDRQWMAIDAAHKSQAEVSAAADS